MQFFYDKFYPIIKKNNKNYKHKVVIGIGGNQGNMRKRFRNLYIYLLKDKRVSITQTSAILQNPPFGFLKQDDFFNAILVLKTSLSPKALLKFLLHVEKKFGRKRSFANAPRTLDLDMIFYNNDSIKTPKLTVPHPHWFERESVVIPLYYLGA